MARDKEKQKIAQAKWYREVVKPRRKKWLVENGPCVVCGSWEKLQVHHKDPSQKESHNVWTWSEERRLNELAKCEVRCRDCHNDAHMVHGPEGTLWCTTCKQFVPIKYFGKNPKKGERRVYRWECNPCRKKKGWS